MTLFKRRWAGEFGEPPKQDSNEIVEFCGPIDIPKNRREAYRTFGNPGTGKVDRKWERANMIVARDLPGVWNSGKGRLYIHKLAEPYLREALRVCEIRGVLHEIEKIGCFNFRHMRHNTKLPLSYHSFGIAIDINPRHNKARSYRHDRPENFSATWDEIWPNGLSRTFVETFKEIGWVWGGDWNVFVDPMHFQLVS